MLNTIDNKNNLIKITKKELINKCKELAIINYSSKNKLELIDIINNQLIEK